MNTARQKMGRGRAPCCEKVGLKKGPWAVEEDMRLVAYINNFGHGNWRALPKQAGLLRCGKSCRLRWTNYLRPDIKRGNFTQEEEETIIRLHGLLGNKWSKIASCLPGRTDNEIKNMWNTHLKKRLPPRESNPSTLESEELTKSSSSSNISSISHCNQGKEVTGDEEQEQAMIKSKNMHDPLEEIIQLPLDEPTMDIWDMLDKSKETPSPSCSACSSYITYSNRVDVHVKGVEDQSSNDNDPPKGVLEIPVEPDMDFWDMLGDGFCSFSCGGKETHQNAAINEEESTGNVDHRRLIYLENEPLVSCPNYDENIEVQVDPIKYFQTWNFTHVTVDI